MNGIKLSIYAEISFRYSESLYEKIAKRNVAALEAELPVDQPQGSKFLSFPKNENEEHWDDVYRSGKRGEEFLDGFSRFKNLSSGLEEMIAPLRNGEARNKRKERLQADVKLGNQMWAGKGKGGRQRPISSQSYFRGKGGKTPSEFRAIGAATLRTRPLSSGFKSAYLVDQRKDKLLSQTTQPLVEEVTETLDLDSSDASLIMRTVQFPPASCKHASSTNPSMPSVPENSRVQAAFDSSTQRPISGGSQRPISGGSQRPMSAKSNNSSSYSSNGGGGGKKQKSDWFDRHHVMFAKDNGTQCVHTREYFGAPREIVDHIRWGHPRDDYYDKLLEEEVDQWKTIRR